MGGGSAGGSGASVGPADATAPPTPRTAPVAATPVAAGRLTAASGVVQYGVVVRPGGDAQAAWKAAKAAIEARSLPPPPAGSVLAVEVEPASLRPFPPKLLPILGVELTAADEAAFQAADSVVRIEVPAAIADLPGAETAAAEAAIAAARVEQGWIIDPAMVQVFTLPAFVSRRPLPVVSDVRSLMVIHEVREEGGLTLLDTAGLARFGLPELVLHGIAASHSAALQLLVNAAAQTLVEQGGSSADGALDVRLDRLRTPGWPATAAAVQEAGGTGAIRLGLRWSVEPDVPLGDAIEIVLPGTGDSAARGYAATAFVAPPEGKVRYDAAADDAELKAARARAHARLAVLALRFANGVPDVESLSVKAPFTTTAGDVEWMWVEVKEWHGSSLTGILLNDPYGAMAVHAGDPVTVDQGDLFDYLWKHDGTSEGDETSAILMRRGE